MANRRSELNKIMQERFAESKAALQAAREQNLNAVGRNEGSIDPEAAASTDKPGDWSIDIPNDVKEVGTEVFTAPTAKPQRPRAYTVAYNSNTRSLIIAMRSGAWIQYNDVSPDIWVGLRNSPSTNDYLPTIENACSGWEMVNPDVLSEGTKARISQSAASAGRFQNIIQQGRIPTYDDIFFPQE